MAIIKCKMCGGDIVLNDDRTFGTCEFCGNTMTLPKIDDEQRAAAFNRGNHFRRIGEFDKALAVYERIVREDDTDAEAHWCCALCRFGIEYVEDPATYEWLPTCHRASFDSFLEDVDYKAALEYSDGITRRQYVKDGAKIAEVQRSILATSQNAEPFDVFICYKESDADGNRTKDSLLAQDIYYQLTEQGRKVFFARITLEDVVGSQYEPYIFAALNSARVMVVVGTKPEYLNAVWVKNEWSRFLAMMKKDRHKLLLPCYRDMDPYDMPEQLSVLQSYDMGKIGFIQDLTRGIAKVLDADKKPAAPKETVVVQQNSNTAPLLKRAFMFLEDGDWNSANEYCEKVLDIDPECADAYLGKLMAELRVRKQENLQNCRNPFDDKSSYQKVMRFGSSELQATLSGYIDHINQVNEQNRLEEAYSNACAAMNNAQTEQDFQNAAELFKAIVHHRNSAQLVQECIDKAAAAKKAAEEARIEAERKAEIARKDALYDSAKGIMMSSTLIADYETAIQKLKQLDGWKDSAELIPVCEQKIAELKEIYARVMAEEKMREAQKIKKTKIIIASLVAVLVVLIVIAMIGIRKSKEADRLQAYDDAVMLMEKGYYESVIPVFENLGDYKDSQARLAEAKAGLEAAEKEAKYNEALNLLDKGKDEDAYQLFQELGDYKDAASFELTFLMTRKVYTYNDSKYYNRTETVYNYDKEGRLARSTSGSGANKAVVNYSHDQNGTMTSIEEGYWSYSSTGKANTDSPHTITREYNEHGDIVKEITVKERIQSNGIPKLQQKIEEVYTYEYDDNGMMTAKTLAGTADTPQSDGSHKITTYSSAETCEYKYDQNGRILTSTTTNDSGNATTWTYSYDKHGNVSSMKAGKSTYSYEYTAKLVKQD